MGELPSIVVRPFDAPSEKLGCYTVRERQTPLHQPIHMTEKSPTRTLAGNGARGNLEQRVFIQLAAFRSTRCCGAQGLRFAGGEQGAEKASLRMPNAGETACATTAFQ